MSNTTKHFLFFAIFLVNTFSCQQKPERLNEEKLNVLETKPSKKIISFKEKWAREKLPTKWIEVKKDSKGYLIYLPCDGETRIIDFRKENGIAEFTNQIESPFLIEYENWNSVQNDNYFFIDLYKNGKIIFSTKGIEHDKTNQVVLFKLKDEKILMTPFENYNFYRRVENKCTENKVQELQFEPIE